MQDFDHQLSGRLSFNLKTFLEKFYLAIAVHTGVWSFGVDFQYDCTAGYLDYIEDVR